MDQWSNPAPWPSTSTPFATASCATDAATTSAVWRRRSSPAPYPVALGKTGPDDEAEALIGFEWHLVNETREGKFALCHPESDGVCVTFPEWIADERRPETTTTRRAPKPSGMRVQSHSPRLRVDVVGYAIPKQPYLPFEAIEGKPTALYNATGAAHERP